MILNNALKRVSTLLFAIVVCVAMMGFTAMPAKAESETDVTVNGFTFHLWYADGGASVALKTYTGAATEIVLPASVTYGGTTYPAANDANWFMLYASTFANNTKVTKIAVPNGYDNIAEGAFNGCTALIELAVGDSLSALSSNGFKGCPAKTYYFKGENVSQASVEGSGIGTDSSGNPISGVTVWTKEGSNVDLAVQELNKSRPADKAITLKYSNDPYSLNTVKPAVAPPVDKTKQKGTDGTYYGAGASKEAVDKALTALKGEKDQKGMAFGKLRLKMKKVAKTSITLGWSKPSGTKQIVIYGNKCGTATKYIKLATVTGTSYKVAKVSGKKVKKGTFYKFVNVALDKNGNVVSTSKTIHVATTGGKVTNHKALTVKAKVSGKYKKVSKISVKKGKKKTLKVKGVKASKKLATKKHVPVRYESANTKIAKVSSKGVITGVKKGKCKVYAIAQSGACKAITVTVK